MADEVEHSPERLVFFSDAVVAIAMTLLILPLADAVPEALAHHVSSLELISENQWKIYSFLLSFAVIARLWIVHHQLYAQVKEYNHALLLTNFCWLLAIIVLPFPTEMVGAYSHDRVTVGFYIGTILVASTCLSAMTTIVRHGGLAKDGAPMNRRRIAAVTPTIALALAFVLALLFPGLSYYPMLLLLLTGPADRLLARMVNEGRAVR